MHGTYCQFSYFKFCSFFHLIYATVECCKYFFSNSFYSKWTFVQIIFEKHSFALLSACFFSFHFFHEIYCIHIYLICLWKVVHIPENISLKFKTNILQSNLINITYRVSQKKFDLLLLVQNCTFFCATLLNGVFSIFFKKL